MELRHLRSLTRRAAGALLLAFGASAAGRAHAQSVTWTDDPLGTATRVRAVHFLELRAAIDRKRAACSLDPMTWTDGLTPGGRIRAAYLNELRGAMRYLYSQVPVKDEHGVSVASPTFTAPLTATSTTPIRIPFIMELRRYAKLALDSAGCEQSCNRAADCQRGPCMLAFCRNNVCVIRSLECFAPGTPIATPSGSVPIERLSPGMSVLGMDDNGSRPTPAVVTAVHRAASDSGLVLALSDGREIRTTAEHPFFDPRTKAYRPAGEMTPGASVLALSDKAAGGTRELTVVAVRSVPGETPVYNLSVSGPAHSFFAGGALVHNKCSCDPRVDPACGL